MRHNLEQSLLDDYENKFDTCVNIAYLIEQSKFKEDFKEISDITLKKAAGLKMLIDHMNKNIILPNTIKQ